MGLLDDAADKARKFAQDNPDQVDQVIDRVGQEVDERTGGRFSDQINQAEDAVRDQLGGTQQDASDDKKA